MGDATNSSIWRRKKLQNLILAAAHANRTDGDWSDELAEGELSWEDAFTHVEQLADILPVSDGTGMGTLAMTHKQLQGLGCPLWSEVPRLVGGCGCRALSEHLRLRTGPEEM